MAKCQADKQTFTILNTVSIPLPFLIDFGRWGSIPSRRILYADFLTQLLKDLGAGDIRFSHFVFRSCTPIQDPHGTVTLIYSRGTYREAMRLWRNQEICRIKWA